jgi:Flp pilus assembly protein TadG
MLSARRAQRGQELIEYAVVMPLLMLLLLGILQFALVFLSYNTLADAARQGARYGVITRSTGAIDLAGSKNEALAVTNAAGLKLKPGDVTATQIGDKVQVKVTYSMNLMIPWVAKPINLVAVSTKQIELE